MMDGRKSLADILSGKDTRLVHSELLFRIVDGDSFITAIHYAIEKIIRPNLESKKSSIIEDEDHISDRVAEALYCLCYPEVSREKSNNGNVDITVGYGEFIWHCEAKIFYDNNRLSDGFKQLTTRYSTPNSNGNQHGGFLIYNFKNNTRKRILKYKEAYQPIFEKEFEDFSFYECEGDFLGFYSSHSDEATGLTYTVKHIPFSFFINPRDKSARESKSSSALEAEKRKEKLNKRKENESNKNSALDS